MRNLYEKLLNIIEDFFSKKNSKLYIYFLSFIESIFFPLPTDIFLFPYVLTNKKSYLRIAIYVTIFSVLGGIVAYYIGFFIWNKISSMLFNIYPSFVLKLNTFNDKFYEIGIILVVIGGFSPFPYKITCIGSGIIGINIFLFTFFSFISRFLRFFLVSYFVFKYGDATKNLIGKYINYVSMFFLIIFIFYVLKYL
ncbi:MAG: hypothetical protein VX009_00500 [Pseudomonadota bacterium]|nr:hypothetical protein [Pseudomonadota bacterium]